MEIDSSIDLPGLPKSAAASAPADLSLAIGPIDQHAWQQQPPRRDAGDSIVVAVAERGAERLLTFGALLAVAVATDGRTAVCSWPHDAPSGTVAHLVAHQVIPLLLAHSGRLVLHASAVVISGRAVLFLGAGGAGKSTMAGSFAAAGFPVMADDAVAVERCGASLLARFTGANVRLWPDSETALDLAGDERRHDSLVKQRIAGAAPVPARADIAAAYVLTDTSGNVRIGSMSRRDAVIELTKHAFVLDVLDRQRLAAHFARLARDVSALEVRTLARPRDFSRLPEVRAAVLEDLDREAPSAEAQSRG